MSDPTLFDQPRSFGGISTADAEGVANLERMLRAHADDPVPLAAGMADALAAVVSCQRAIEPSIQERFYAFDQTNPHVYARLEQMTAQLVARGRRRVGMKMLFEVLRWERALSTDDPTSEFRLNNVYSSRYSRKLMDAHPEWEGIFGTRELKA